jgi:uncharacterized protein Veg
MIEKIKSNINDNIGNNVKLVINNLRNKSEEYQGIIAETYNYVFVIKTNDNVLKSFSYSDVLTQNIELFFK